MTDFEMLQAILDEIKNVKHDINARLDKIENRLDKFENRLDKLEKEVKHNTAMLEGEFDKMVDLLGEGFQMTVERLNSADLDSMRNKINELEILCKFNREEISVLRKKIS